MSFDITKDRIPSFVSTISHEFTFVLWAVIWPTIKIWPSENRFFCSLYIMVVFSLAQMYCNIHSKTVCMEFSDWNNIFLVFNPHFSEYKYWPPIQQGEPVRDISLPFFLNGYWCRTRSEWPGPGTSSYLILVHAWCRGFPVPGSQQRMGTTDFNHRATHVRCGVCPRHIGTRLDWMWSPSIRSGKNGSQQ